MIKPFRMAAGLLIVGIISIALTACGSGGAKVVATQDTEDTEATAAASVETTETTETTESVKVEEPVVTEAVKEDATTLAMTEKPAEPADEPGEPATTDEAAVQDSATLEINLPEAETAVEALPTSYDEYGFALKLDLGAEVQAGGWTEAEPSSTQGIIAFNYGGVNANLVWGPPEERTALTFLADTYNVLRASQPSVTFESISDGDITVNEQAGVYGGFKAIDDTGASLGGGLIGAWGCGDAETAFRMTLTGVDATVVQLRFDRLLENFTCSSS